LRAGLAAPPEQLHRFLFKLGRECLAWLAHEAPPSGYYVWKVSTKSGQDHVSAPWHTPHPLAHCEQPLSRNSRLSIYPSGVVSSGGELSVRFNFSAVGAAERSQKKSAEGRGI